jgi:hypothetical protein
MATSRSHSASCAGSSRLSNRRLNLGREEAKAALHKRCGRPIQTQGDISLGPAEATPAAEVTSMGREASLLPCRSRAMYTLRR